MWTTLATLPSLVQRSLDSLGEGLDRERLLQERDAWVQHVVVDNDVVGVPGHKEDLDMGTESNQSLVQLATVHLGHDHIGE